jgi:perosamine synthetase
MNFAPWCVKARKKAYSVSEDRAYIPYGRHAVDGDDEAAVLDALRSDWLTTGPMVAQFESDICQYMRMPYAVAVSSGTAALHAAVNAAGIGPGDEVIVSPLTFVASANCILYEGGTPVFADVERDTLLLSAQSVARMVTPETRAIIAVDYAGQPCDYTALRALCEKHNLILIADCAHSIGARLHGKSVASYADLATFSFHPVKHITSGEGGMVVTHREDWALRMKRFRNHGIDMDHAARAENRQWQYSMAEPGYNYRISDIQCALAASQLKKLDRRIQRRNEIAALYDEAFRDSDQLELLQCRPGVVHARHLYVLRLAKRYGAVERQKLFDFMRMRQIGVNVHYIPVYQHEYYVRHFGGDVAECPNVDQSADRILSIPMYSSLTDAQVRRVIRTVRRGLAALDE